MLTRTRILLFIEKFFYKYVCINKGMALPKIPRGFR